MKKLLLLSITVLSLNLNAQISLVKDFNEGSGNGNPLIYGIYKNKIYLFGTNKSFQSESYTYDGVNLEQITDNDGNSVNITPTYFPAEGADDPMIIRLAGENGTFTFNGTTFTKIADDNPSGGGIKFNGKYYFTIAKAGATFFDPTTYPLAFTDGTAAGTSILKDGLKTFISFNTTERAVVNNALVFVAEEDTNGKELYVTDGTEAGTVLLKDIYIGDKNSDPEDFFVTEDKSKLFFTAKTESEGRELWVTDGTETGTKMLKDIHNGTSGDDVDAITEMNGNVYFEANGKLWKTDGTPENTIEIADADARYMIVLNNELFFHDSKSMFKTDGTVAGTSKINPDNVGVEWSSFPVLFNNEIYFAGSILDSNGQISDNELWKTDGTTAGTIKVKVIDPDFPVTPSRFIEVGNELIFNAVTRDQGQELWKTDGTTAGTMMIEDFSSGSSGFIANFTTPAFHIVLNNTLVFSANANKGLGQELYKYENGATASVNDFFESKLQLYYSENTIHFKNWEPQNPELRIYNLLGKEVLNTNIKKTQSSLDINLKKGVYIARYFSEKGEPLSKKFLVE